MPSFNACNMNAKVPCWLAQFHRVRSRGQHTLLSSCSSIFNLVARTPHYAAIFLVPLTPSCPKTVAIKEHKSLLACFSTRFLFSEWSRHNQRSILTDIKTANSQTLTFKINLSMDRYVTFMGYNRKINLSSVNQFFFLVSEQLWITWDYRSWIFIYV